MIHLGGTVLAHEALAPLLVPIEDLRPHPDNPKCGDTDAICQSLETNGMYRPLYVTDTGTILAGNHTYMAALELGAEHLPVIRLHVDPVQAQIIMLADNRIADLGRYDEGLLLDLLANLDEQDALTGTGYTTDDLELLRLAQIEPAAFGEPPTGDLVIHGLPLTAIGMFRDIPGDDDRVRFLKLLGESVD